MEGPQKPEQKETAERPPRYRTLSREVLEPLKDGIETVRVIECNGITHRCCVEKVSYDDAGEIDFVDEVSRDITGACPGGHQ